MRLLIEKIYILQNGLSNRRIINLMSYLLYAAFSNKYDRLTGFFFQEKDNSFPFCGFRILVSISAQYVWNKIWKCVWTQNIGA